MDKMPENPGWKEVQDEVSKNFKDYLILTLTGLINGLYVIGWAVLQWGVDAVLTRFYFIGISALVLESFQIIFAIATVVPPCLYIYRDFRISLLKMNQQIKNEAKRKQRK